MWLNLTSQKSKNGSLTLDSLKLKFQPRPRLMNIETLNYRQVFLTLLRLPWETDFQVSTEIYSISMPTKSVKKTHGFLWKKFLFWIKNNLSKIISANYKVILKDNLKREEIRVLEENILLQKFQKIKKSFAWKQYVN